MSQNLPISINPAHSLLRTFVTDQVKFSLKMPWCGQSLLINTAQTEIYLSKQKLKLAGKS